MECQVLLSLRNNKFSMSSSTNFLSINKPKKFESIHPFGGLMVCLQALAKMNQSAKGTEMTDSIRNSSKKKKKKILICIKPL